MPRVMSSKHGVVILNLGSPKSPEIPDVREYLREFLGDERVIDTNPFVKWFVLNLILLLRPAKSSAAYKTVWTPEGSPLLVITEKLRKAVQAVSGEVKVYTAMRYAEPSCDNVAKQIAADGVTDLLIIPQYPQYAMSSYETAEVRMREALAEHAPAVKFTLVQPFYDDPGYIDAMVEVARPYLEKPYDKILFSFHGVPRRHMVKADSSRAHCMSRPDCCEIAHPCQSTCYRHQCFATTNAFVAKAGIPADKHEVSFQSRLGREEWLKPYTDFRLNDLPKKGVKKLLVFSPAFTADCLETLEEMAEEGKETFLHAGGESYELVPCLNDHPAYVAWTADRITRWLAGERRL